MDIKDQHLNLAQWYDVIETALQDTDAEPILNLRDDGAGVYDAVFLGGIVCNNGGKLIKDLNAGLGDGVQIGRASCRERVLCVV